METKFQLLAIGQHFEWEGKSYVKSTPLLATQVPEGGQKFMPRAAMVKVVGTGAPAEPLQETPVTLDIAAVRSAVAHYHQRVQNSVATAQQRGKVPVQLQAELEQLYRELLAELKL